MSGVSGCDQTPCLQLPAADLAGTPDIGNVSFFNYFLPYMKWLQAALELLFSTNPAIRTEEISL